MNRKIKFRAWLKDLEIMQIVSELNMWNLGHVFTVDEDNFQYKTSGNVNYILMQYTGLKDKNGVEIYEGDIVEIKDHSFQKKPGDYTGIEIDGFYPVTYTERMELVAGQWLLMHQLPYINVVGNIYENPELLEESAE